MKKWLLLLLIVPFSYIVDFFINRYIPKTADFFSAIASNMYFIIAILALAWTGLLIFAKHIEEKKPLISRIIHIIVILQISATIIIFIYKLSMIIT